jgi:hypothetical protein
MPRITDTTCPVITHKILVFQKAALTICVLVACFLLTAAAPPKLNDEKNNEGKVGMRYFPGAGYPGLYPGIYPGGIYPGAYSGFYPGGYPGGYHGAYPGPYGLPFGAGYPPIRYPMGPYPGISFYNSKGGNSPTGNKAAPTARN